MSSQGHEQWGGSLHQTFRLYPADNQSPTLRPFLESDGLSMAEVIVKLPYDRARAPDPASQGPDAKRYRDPKQVYQTAGLLYEVDGVLHVTELGEATRRWLTIVNEKNRLILVRHAAYALAACQLRNPTGAGKKYANSMSVFPFAFIWRAMLALDGRISSDELNRGLFKVKNEDDLKQQIVAIRDARTRSDVTLLGDETETGDKKNDRIIPWISLASFGWSLFPDKKRTADGAYYELDPYTLPVIREASKVRHRHREFDSTLDYVEYVARCAALPKDLR